MTQNSQLLDIISDPITGPYEGEDFCIDEEGYIQVSDNNVRTAALIMRILPIKSGINTVY